MDWYKKQLSRLPTQEEIDRTWFHLVTLIIAGLMLAFSLGIVVGSRCGEHNKSGKSLNFHLAASSLGDYLV